MPVPTLPSSQLSATLEPSTDADGAGVESQSSNTSSGDVLNDQMFTDSIRHVARHVRSIFEGFYGPDYHSVALRTFGYLVIDIAFNIPSPLSTRRAHRVLQTIIQRAEEVMSAHPVAETIVPTQAPTEDLHAQAEELDEPDINGLASLSQESAYVSS